MFFDSVRTGNLVRWSRALLDNCHTLEDAQLWEDEPNCIMEVIQLEGGRWNEKIHFECVLGCGNHNITDISKDIHDEYCTIIGKDILEAVNSMSEVLEELGSDMNIEDQCTDILQDLLAEENFLLV